MALIEKWTPCFLEFFLFLNCFHAATPARNKSRHARVRDSVCLVQTLTYVPEDVLTGTNRSISETTKIYSTHISQKHLLYTQCS